MCVRDVFVNGPLTTYTQLTQEQRYSINALLKTEHSQTKIATVIGVKKIKNQ